MKYKVVIGLEVHCELETNSKKGERFLQLSMLNYIHYSMDNCFF